MKIAELKIKTKAQAREITMLTEEGKLVDDRTKGLMLHLEKLGQLLVEAGGEEKLKRTEKEKLTYKNNKQEQNILYLKKQLEILTIAEQDLIKAIDEIKGFLKELNNG